MDRQHEEKAGKKADVETPAQDQPPTGDLGASQVDAAVAEEEERGLRGTEVDPTPNENYTVAGVTAKKPTPETDADTKAEARKAAGL
jgi:hypothetical protein